VIRAQSLYCAATDCGSFSECSCLQRREAAERPVGRAHNEYSAEDWPLGLSTTCAGAKY
jgi:hypothetical protein